MRSIDQLITELEKETTSKGKELLTELLDLIILELETNSEYLKEGKNK